MTSTSPPHLFTWNILYTFLTPYHLEEVSCLSLVSPSPMGRSPNATQVNHLPHRHVRLNILSSMTDVSFSCVVKSQRRWSKKNYKTELTKTRYNNQVLGKYRVDPQRVGLTLIVELTWSNLGLKRVLNKIK